MLMLFSQPCCLGTNVCPSLIDTTSLRVPPCNITNFTMFSLSHKNCPFTKYATAVNLLYKTSCFFSHPKTETVSKTSPTLPRKGMT